MFVYVVLYQSKRTHPITDKVTWKNREEFFLHHSKAAKACLSMQNIPAIYRKVRVEARHVQQGE